MEIAVLLAFYNWIKLELISCMEGFQMPNRCIYCNNDSSLTESDIIPFALTTKKLASKNVCLHHNKHINVEAENTAINSLFVLRKQIGLPNRHYQELSCSAKIDIDGEIYHVDEYTDLFCLTNKGIKAKDNNGNEIILGIPDKANPQHKAIEYFSDNVKMSIQLPHSSINFDSDEMLRMIAKIGFEWFCKIRNVNTYQIAYKNIIDYIMRERVATIDDSIVQIITAPAFYKQIYNELEIGANCISITNTTNGDIYAILIFMGLVAYKIKISHTNLGLLRNARSDFIGYRTDGSQILLKVPKLLNTPDIPSKHPKDGMADIYDIVYRRFVTDSKWRILSINGIRRNVLVIKNIVNDSRIVAERKFATLFSLTDNQIGPTIFLLLKLGEYSSQYNFDLPFDENIKALFNITDTLKLSMDKVRLFIKTKSDNGDSLIDLLQRGICLYQRIS